MRNSKEKKSKHIFHNYFILLGIFIVCILFVLYVCEIYKINDAEKKKTPVIDGVLLEIYK